MKMTINSIRDETLARLKTCWAEMAFIVMLAAGVVCFTYAVLLFLAQVMGIHSTYYVLPLFDELPLYYVIPAAVMILIVYIGSIPLFFGIRWFYWHLSGGAVMSIDSVFAPYDSRRMIRRCIAVRLITDLRKLLRLAVFGAVGYASVFALIHVTGTNERTIMSVATFIIFILLVLYYVSVMDLAFVPYIFADNPDLPVSEIMKRSKEAIRSRMSFSVNLFFSCLPWYLATFFVFPLMFVLPITNVLHAIYLRHINEEKDEKAA
ncbi:MAG: hypothetical protein ILP19_00840 [Oscillospiraceae bacterium]|nr:hypothetical protein [Oscillospiraceae bacterium]